MNVGILKSFHDGIPYPTHPPPTYPLTPDVEREDDQKLYVTLRRMRAQRI